MKRHPALRDLSEDHHHGLVQARRLMKAAEDFGEEGPRRKAEEVAQAFLEFFEAHTRPHFREEEEILLPSFAGHGDVAQAPFVRMLIEHVQINLLVRSLAAEVRLGEPSPETMGRLGVLLQGHIRHEENVIFPLIEKALPTDAMAALAAELRGSKPGQASTA
jgi:hemerythrin-like domain-containing protein